MEQTIQKTYRIRSTNSLLLLLLSMLLSLGARAQINEIEADLSLIDGIEITPDNMFNYRINNRSSQTKQVEVNGRVFYRKSALSFTYKFNTTVQPGINHISRAAIPNPNFTFSETGLRELFLTYNKLPQGTYEYCVSIRTYGVGAESADASDAACVYQTVEDMFLINLVTPENDAKIYEYNPMLGWVVNYPFASELTYKLRVAELKQGQNPQNAITRNNPVYKDDHVMTTGTIYPVTARPLQKWQPYVWTVDAYYKGILLGGAEVWKFTIIDDSELVAVPVEQSYTHINVESGRGELFAVGMLKLKYTLEDSQNDILTIRLFEQSGKEVRLKQKELKAEYGDNRYVFQIKDVYNLKHTHKYRLELTNIQSEKFIIYFKYANPDLIK